MPVLARLRLAVDPDRTVPLGVTTYCRTLPELLMIFIRVLLSS
jgi:hypothetical protein